MTHTLDLYMPDFTVKEAAARLSIEARTLQYYIKRGLLKAIKEQRPKDGYPAPTYFIDDTELDRFREWYDQRQEERASSDKPTPLKLPYGPSVQALVERVYNNPEFIFTRHQVSQVVDTALIALARRIEAKKGIPANKLKTYRLRYNELRAEEGFTSMNISDATNEAIETIGKYLAGTILGDIASRTFNKGETHQYSKALIIIIALLYWSEYE